MRRTTVQQIARAGTLRNFLAKNPSARAGGLSPATGEGYNWALGTDRVTNFGANSDISVWDPAVTGGDDHSLSQQWISTGSGTKVQTAEGGWIKASAWGSLPAVFVCWTANDYQSTGCYNLTCAGFVQTNDSVALGEPVTPCCSATGGTNDYFSQTYELSGGDWWYGINGTWIGYYPTSIYGSGQMATKSTEVQFGGEVYNNGNTWSQMGSGEFAKAGAGEAAYQNNITYLNSSLGSENVALRPVDQQDTLHDQVLQANQ